MHGKKKNEMQLKERESQNIIEETRNLKLENNKNKDVGYYLNTK